MVPRVIWKTTKYLFLVVFSSIVGAQLGLWGGLAVAAITGDPSWVAHGRCAGWTLFFLLSAVGAPLGIVRFYSGAVNRPTTSGNRPALPAVERQRNVPAEGQRTEGGIRAILIAPLIGGFGGLILGGILGGYLVALYFFVALSPLGPGGWWPVLPLAFQSNGDGFSTKDAFLWLPWLVIVGTFVVLGAFLGLFESATWGHKRFQAFRSHQG